MAIILAVESSTPEASVALLDGDRIIAESRWQSARNRTDGLISALRRLIDGSGVTFESISMYAVGTGPGGFTGLRTSSAAAQALALPSKTPVTGVCSADATAFAIRRELQTQAPILIVGDARRDRLWSVFCPDTDTPHTETVVTGIDDAQSIMSTTGLVIATPDWNRLETALEKTIPPSATLIRAPRIPTAADVGRLAFRRTQAGTPALPAVPIYVHPPVFIEPVFTESAKRRIAQTL